MVYLEKKTVRGRVYWYAVEKARVNGKLKKTWQLYLGSARRIAERMKESEGLVSTKLKSFSYGKTAALLDVSEDLGFVEAVDKHAQKKRVHGLTVGEYMLLIILGRCDKPVSKNAMAAWFTSSPLSVVWGFRHSLSCQNFLNHMRRLDTVRGRVEEDLARTLLDKGLRPSTLIYDTTNFYTYLEHGETLPQKGHSKHHRHDKNLVALGLVVGDHNLPFLHHVYEANRHDSRQFPRLLDDLAWRLTRLHLDAKDLVLVFDKGNNSTPSLKKVVEDMHVVGSVTHEQAKDLADVPLEKYVHVYTTEKGHHIKGYRTRKQLFGVEFTVVASYNEHTRRRQARTYEKHKQEIFMGLRDLNRRLKSSKGRRRSRSSVEREIHDVIRTDMRSVVHYTLREVDGRFHVAYRTNKQAEILRQSRFGKTLVFTDLHHWHTKKIVESYHRKHLVEDDFKWFNNTALIPVKPLFVRLDESIRVHLFLCVMGLLFYRYLFWKLRGFKLSGQRILEELNGIRAALVKPHGENKTHLVFEEMTPTQARLFTHLNLSRFLNTQ